MSLRSILRAGLYLPFSASGGALLFHLLSKLYERTNVSRFATTPNSI